MLAKHSTAMTASRGADKKTQQMVQTFARGMLRNSRAKATIGRTKHGEVLVFNFSVDQHAADEQMQLNAKTLSILGDMQDLPGIGDQAFRVSGRHDHGAQRQESDPGYVHHLSMRHGASQTAG